MRIVVEVKPQQSDDAESLVGSRCSVLCGGFVSHLLVGHLLFGWHFREGCRKAKEVSVRGGGVKTHWARHGHTLDTSWTYKDTYGVNKTDFALARKQQVRQVYAMQIYGGRRGTFMA